VLEPANPSNLYGMSNVAMIMLKVDGMRRY